MQPKAFIFFKIRLDSMYYETKEVYELKILIISHNAFSESVNMGKTLVSYFNDFNANDIAQFYIQAEVPTVDVCKNYYRVTDKDMVKSIFGKKVGCVLGENDIEYGRKNVKNYEGVEKKLHNRAGKRTPMTYVLRNLLWKLGHWNSKKLKKWIDDFSPDCVFFASGDYSFMYDIALKTAQSRNIPLYVSCMDDYYINNNNKGKFLGTVQYKYYLKHVKKTMEYASAIFCICDSMTEKYSEFFNKKCVTIHTAASFDEPLSSDKNGKISYIGGLSYGRYVQLADIGRELKKLGMELDVYAPEKSDQIQSYMSAENGINYHGRVSAKEVKEIMAQSMAVVHTESFDEEIKDKVRYSVSTKIADSLMSGTCIFAYGPDDIASVKYLKDNNAAYCVTSKDDLADGLKDFISNAELRNNTVKNAVDLANKNHRPGNNYNVIFDVISSDVKDA